MFSDVTVKREPAGRMGWERAAEATQDAEPGRVEAGTMDRPRESAVVARSGRPKGRNADGLNRNVLVCELRFGGRIRTPGS